MINPEDFNKPEKTRQKIKLNKQYIFTPRYIVFKCYKNRYTTLKKFDFIYFNARLLE